MNVFRSGAPRAALSALSLIAMSAGCAPAGAGDRPSATVVVTGAMIPTGGELTSSRDEIIKIYETGSGSVGLRGEWKTEDDKKAPRIIITSIPYGLEKKGILEKIADVPDSLKAEVRACGSVRTEARAWCATSRATVC